MCKYKTKYVHFGDHEFSQPVKRARFVFIIVVESPTQYNFIGD